MYNRPFTVQSKSKRQELEREQEEAKKNIGVFSTKEMRGEVAKEIKKTHFTFGSDKQQFPQSLNKETYQNVQVDDKNISNQQKKMSKINKRSNFIFGNDTGNNETTSNQAYNSKQFSNLTNSGPNAYSANTLRKGNFRLGFNKDNMYETTAQSNFTDKNNESDRAIPNAHRADKKSHLTHVYGYSKPSYQTMNNTNFTEKDVSDSFKDKLLMKQRGQNLKQTNFSFGNFSNNSGTNSMPIDTSGRTNKYQADFAKQNQEAKQRGVELKKSNFKFSDKSKPNDDNFKSMAQVHFDEEHMRGDHVAQMNQNNREMSKNLQKDLRSSHFNFGNTEGDNQSCSHNAHPKYAIDQKGLEESGRLAKKMQQPNFEIGNNKYKGLPLRSTYKDSISGNASFNPLDRAKTDVDSKKTTIDIGKGKCYDYTSEAKSKYIVHHGGMQTIDKDTKNSLNYLKQNHFELGNGKNDFGTINKQDYSLKPNTGYIKYTSDIQKSSFAIGYQGNQFGSVTPSKNALSYTDRGKSVPYQRVVGELSKSTHSTKASNHMQKENFSLGKNTGEFRTMNQAYYKWIQPQGDVIPN